MLKYGKNTAAQGKPATTAEVAATKQKVGKNRIMVGSLLLASSTSSTRSVPMKLDFKTDDLERIETLLYRLNGSKRERIESWYDNTVSRINRDFLGIVALNAPPPSPLLPRMAIPACKMETGVFLPAAE